MSDDISTYCQRRGLAAAFTLCALSSLTLLANHPSGSPGSFADLIKDEAAHQVIDGVVHGGFVVTLVALVICFVLLSRFLGLAKTPVVIGLVCFCVGCGALIASMVLDGFATPTIAVRFAAQASMADVGKFLDQYQASLAGGPRPGNLYRLRIGDTALPREELSNIVRQMAQEKIVEFVATAQ